MRTDGRQTDQLRPVQLEPDYIVMNAAGRYIEVQGTAEHQPFDRAALDRLLDLAAGGIGALLAAQREALAGA